MTEEKQMAQDAHKGGTGKYIVGFVISIILTLAAFLPVMYNWMADWSISAKIIYLLGLAIIQMMVQVAFFLHLTEGVDAKWNILTMYSAIVCVFIIVVGSWWVMWHANYQVMGSNGRVVQSDVIYPADNAPSAPAEEKAAPQVEQPAEQSSNEETEAAPAEQNSSAAAKNDSSSEQTQSSSQQDAAKTE